MSGGGASETPPPQLHILVVAALSYRRAMTKIFFCRKILLEGAGSLQFHRRQRVN
jgi:hypothetical protein